MATIRSRRQADGTIRYTAIVRIRKGTLVLHQEHKTFASASLRSALDGASRAAPELPSHRVAA